MVANSGHFDVEINVKELEKMAVKVNKNVRNNVDEYVIGSRNKELGIRGKAKSVKSIYLLAEGRLVNLAAAEGHPASVMDMSFSTQALAAEYVAKNHSKLGKKVYSVPVDIEQWVAELKLKSMGVEIDKLTKEQEEYLRSWEIGT
jgi:adenosylhomocysteinase